MSRRWSGTIPDGEGELELDAEYSIFGKYHPASMDGPEEWPEMEIETVLNAGTNVEIKITEKQTELLTDKIWESLED